MKCGNNEYSLHLCYVHARSNLQFNSIFVIFLIDNAWIKQLKQIYFVKFRSFFGVKFHVLIIF